jgi:hypothetical protein
MTQTYTFKAEDIFEDIPGDEKNVVMNIPPVIQEKMGWKPGDVLKINTDQEGVISITKVEKDKNGEK